MKTETAAIYISDRWERLFQLLVLSMLIMSTTMLFGESLPTYNHLGQSVRIPIDNEIHQAGTRVVIWEGKDERGAAVSSGICFLRLKTEAYHAVHRLVKFS